VCVRCVDAGCGPVLGVAEPGGMAGGGGDAATVQRTGNKQLQALQLVGLENRLDSISAGGRPVRTVEPGWTTAQATLFSSLMMIPSD
jgi:hypothetical protein